MFDDITPESIKTAILDALDTDMDTREGSFLNDMIAPVAMEIWKCYRSLDALVPIAYVDESSGGYIDLRCAEFGLTRKAGAAAAAAITFAGTSGTVIPAGTAFFTSGGLEYTLDAAVTLADGAGAGMLTASAVGEAYNVVAGAISTMAVAIAGLTSFSCAAAAGGVDEEADADLAARLYARLQEPATSGNAYHYRQWALEVSGVGDARVLPLWAGAGTVKVLLVDADKAPVDGAVVTAAAAYIAEEAPIGATVTVESAEGLTVNVAATVTIDSTTTLTAVQAALVSNLDTYLKDLAFTGYTLLYNRVAFLLMNIDGVVDYSVLTVNDGTENLTIADNEVPVLGTVTVS